MTLYKGTKIYYLESKNIYFCLCRNRYLENKSLKAIQFEITTGFKYF